MFFLLTFLGCKTIPQGKVNEYFLKVVKITDYEFCFSFTALNEVTRDSVHILSFKDNYYAKYDLPKPLILPDTSILIQANKSYDFKLIRTNVRVLTMEQLGAFIIIENDTIFQASNLEALPLVYTAQNTRGVYLN